MNSTTTPPTLTQGDTLFRCLKCQREETHRLRDVLLGDWPVCATCQGTHMSIVETKTTIATAVDQIFTPVMENVGEALRDLNREQ